jgi:hypothetical protein
LTSCGGPLVRKLESKIREQTYKASVAVLIRSLLAAPVSPGLVSFFLHSHQPHDELPDDCQEYFNIDSYRVERICNYNENMVSWQVV